MDGVFAGPVWTRREILMKKEIKNGFRFVRECFYLLMTFYILLEAIFGEYEKDDTSVLILFAGLSIYLGYKIIRDWDPVKQKGTNWRKRANILLGVAAVFAFFSVASGGNTAVSGLILAFTLTSLFMLYLNPETEAETQIEKPGTAEEASEPEEAVVVEGFPDDFESLLRKAYEVERKIPDGRAASLDRSIRYQMECKREGLKLSKPEEELICGILIQYLDLSDDLIQTEKTKATLESIRNFFPHMESAFQNLYEKKVDEASLDIESSISALKFALRQSGLAPSDFEEQNYEEEPAAL